MQIDSLSSFNVLLISSYRLQLFNPQERIPSSIHKEVKLNLN